MCIFHWEETKSQIDFFFNYRSKRLPVTFFHQIISKMTWISGALYYSAQSIQSTIIIWLPIIIRLKAWLCKRHFSFGKVISRFFPCLVFMAMKCIQQRQNTWHSCHEIGFFQYLVSAVDNMRHMIIITWSPPYTYKHKYCVIARYRMPASAHFSKPLIDEQPCKIRFCAAFNQIICAVTSIWCDWIHAYA